MLGWVEHNRTHLAPMVALMPPPPPLVRGRTVLLRELRWLAAEPRVRPRTVAPSPTSSVRVLPATLPPPPPPPALDPGRARWVGYRGAPTPNSCAVRLSVLALGRTGVVSSVAGTATKGRGGARAGL
jgi:hypothetical protein